MDDDFTAAFREMGVRGGSDPWCLLVAEWLFLLRIATPWTVRSGGEGHSSAASSWELAGSSSSRSAEGGSSSKGPISLSAVYPESADIADGPLLLFPLSPSLLSFISTPSCLIFSNLLRIEDFPLPLPGRVELCLDRTDIRELVDLSDGVGEGGALFSAVTGSEGDATWTLSVVVWGGSGLGRVSIVADSGATAFVFDAPQPIVRRTTSAVGKEKET